jgi:hypothetical protein
MSFYYHKAPTEMAVSCPQESGSLIHQFFPSCVPRQYGLCSLVCLVLFFSR